MPNLPDYYFLNTPFAFSKNELVLVIFALVMLMASFSMIRSSNIVDSIRNQVCTIWTTLMSNLADGGRCVAFFSK